MEKRELQITADGSHTLFVPSMDEHYHSINGAIQESVHVFINAGFQAIQKKQVRILEIGFGTGLNAFLTLKETESTADRSVCYYSIELYPLPAELVKVLNYSEVIWKDRATLFDALHTAVWNSPVPISDQFTLHKIEGDSNNVELPAGIDLIYFDAFAPEKQPEMWESAIFDKLFNCMADGGIIVTYCAKGEVRRRMQQAGFIMERLPGPPGKRHMLRGRKP